LGDKLSPVAGTLMVIAVQINNPDWGTLDRTAWLCLPLV